MKRGFAPIVIVLGVLIIIMLTGGVYLYLNQKGGSKFTITTPVKKEGAIQVNIYTPEEIFEKRTDFDNKEIQVKGIITVVSLGQDKLDGLGIAGPAFQSSDGLITLSGNREIYDAADSKKEVVVRGTFKLKKDSANSFGYLEVPIKCEECVKVIEN